jgi:hypothetical protein
LSELVGFKVIAHCSKDHMPFSEITRKDIPPYMTRKLTDLFNLANGIPVLNNNIYSGTPSTDESMDKEKVPPSSTGTETTVNGDRPLALPEVVT